MTTYYTNLGFVTIMRRPVGEFQCDQHVVARLHMSSLSTQYSTATAMHVRRGTVEEQFRVALAMCNGFQLWSRSHESDWSKGDTRTTVRGRFVTGIRKSFHLYELLCTRLARRVIAVPRPPATNAHEAIATPAGVLARLAVDRRRDRRVWGIVTVPPTIATGASQLHAKQLFLSLFLFPFSSLFFFLFSSLFLFPFLSLFLFRVLFLQVESLPHPEFQ